VKNGTRVVTIHEIANARTCQCHQSCAPSAPNTVDIPPQFLGTVHKIVNEDALVRFDRLPALTVIVPVRYLRTTTYSEPHHD
jgi:hypothetical protein